MRDAWDRQPGESGKAFAAFLVYRDSDPRRISTAARECRKAESLLRRWSARWDWQSRISEFDSYLARQRLARREKRLAVVEDRAVELMDDAISRAIQRLRSMDPEEIPAGQVVRMLKDALETQLKVLGHEDAARVRVEGKVEVEATADAAWLLDYLRGLPERSGETPEPAEENDGR